MENFNLISNNCVGARYYERKNGFTNPFMWNSIKYEDFIYLIKNFDKINFKNIKSKFTNNEIYREKDIENVPCIVLDNKINIYYIHHFYNKEHPTKKIFRNKKSEENFNNGILNKVEYDMSGNDILKYLENCWNKRLKKTNFNNKNIFVYWDSQDYTRDNDISELFKLKGNFKIIVISEKDYSNLQDKNHIYLKTYARNTITMGKVLDVFLDMLQD